MLLLSNLAASFEQRKILKGINLEVKPGSIHALMGPNGSGKSTLAHVLMGHPDYTVTQGSISFNNTDITTYGPDKRAHMGIFLAFQHPIALPGVSVTKLLCEAYRMRYAAAFSQTIVQEKIVQACDFLGVDPHLTKRSLNEGFSGGEKKRLEMVQLLVLAPEIAILDEIDSGLDVDGLKMVAASLEYARSVNPGMQIIMITHYQRILQYIQPHMVHVMHDGVIVGCGGPELVQHIEHAGYAHIGAYVSQQAGSHAR